MKTPSIRVVIVEDEVNIRRFIKLALEHEGLNVIEAGNVQRGLIDTATQRGDLVILDLGLPDRDGLEFIRDLRTWSAIPIIVLSARTAETDKVMALDAGADDYLTKPFGVAELLARVRAQLRRCIVATGDNDTTIIEFGAVRIDLIRRIVERCGVPVHLTPVEYRLLTCLIAHPDRVLTHNWLLKNVWGATHGTDSHYVRVYMRQLRKKLESDPGQPQHFLTEIGVGYRFVNENS